MDKRQKVAKQGEQGLIWRTFVAIIGTKKRNTEFLDLNKIHFILICFPSYIQTPLRTSPGAAFVYTFRASQSLPPVAANKIKIIFRRGVYLAKNTAQDASVEFVPSGDKFCARRLQNGQKSPPGLF